MKHWLDIVTEAAEQRWSEGRPLFFAQVPSVLKRAELDVREVLRGRTLREALALDGAQRFQIVSDPRRPKVWAIIPRTAPDDTSLDALFSPTKAPQAMPPSAPRSIPRFKRAFWAAFVRALQPGQKRYISRDGFEDVPENEPAPIDAIPIDAKDIRSLPQGTPVDSGAVFSAIRSWAERTGAKLGDYSASARWIARAARTARSVSFSCATG